MVLAILLLERLGESKPTIAPTQDLSGKRFVFRPRRVRSEHARRLSFWSEVVSGQGDCGRRFPEEQLYQCTRPIGRQFRSVGGDARPMSKIVGPKRREWS